jgi:hypothetical protein
MSASGENKTEESSSLGRQSRAALRVAGRKAGKSRWTRAFYRGSSSFLSSVGHVIHALWLEVTGFLFLVLAVIGSGAAVREYHRYTAGTATRGRVVLAAGFALLFLYFGIESFLRARRKGRENSG